GLNAAKVDALAESMASIGLQTPISIWAPDDYTVILVAGRHRLAAAEKLGWVSIDCVFVNDLATEIDRELWEIDENLCRAQLTPTQHAQHLARRKELYEAKYPETRAGVAGAEAKHRGATDKLSFAADTAAKTGQSERNIQRATRRGEKIAPDVLEKIEG